MITADVLARELGCTLTDLEDLGIVCDPITGRAILIPSAAARFRAAWSDRTGIDYTK